MGLASWFAQRNGMVPGHPLGAFEPAVDARSSSALYSVGDPALAMVLGYSNITGEPVGEIAAMNLSAVYRAVSIIAGAIGSLPLRTLSTDPDGQTTRVPSFLDNPGGDRFTPVEWAELVLVQALLHGNAYLQHIYNAAGALAALYPVHPGCVTTEWNDQRPGGKTYKITGMRSDGEPYSDTFDASTMTQIMGPSLDGLVGISALHAGRLSLGTGIAGEKAANRTYRNGAMISGLVTPADNEADLDEDEAATVKRAINKTMTGPENAGDIAVMSRALKFQSWQMSATDAQFMESRLFSVDEVGRWFGVPPHLLGLTEKSTSWGQGIAEQNRGLARYTLTPWTGRIEDRTSRLLPAARKAEFDYTAFVRPSPEDEIKLLIAQVNAGLITPNEAREIRNMRPVTGGEKLRIPAGAADPNARPAPAPTTGGGQ